MLSWAFFRSFSRAVIGATHGTISNFKSSRRAVNYGTAHGLKMTGIQPAADGEDRFCTVFIAPDRLQKTAERAAQPASSRQFHAPVPGHRG